MFGIAVVQISWRWATSHLYSLPPEALAGFVSITTNTLYITGAIVIFMVTGRLVYDWKMGTSQIQEVVSRVEEIKENLTNNAKESGYETSF
jgi:acetyl-CoA carboxylase carboxyltransferase component